MSRPATRSKRGRRGAVCCGLAVALLLAGPGVSELPAQGAEPRAQSAAPVTRGATTAEGGHFWAAWVDIIAPGFGLAHNRRYVWAGVVGVSRLLLVGIALDYRRRAREYRSAERAATLADLVYGPGIEYQDPYSDDTITSEEFGRRADRRQYISSLAWTLQVAATAFSVGFTYLLEQEKEAAATPILRFEPEQSYYEPGGPVRFRFLVGFSKQL